MRRIINAGVILFLCFTCLFSSLIFQGVIAEGGENLTVINAEFDDYAEKNLFGKKTIILKNWETIAGHVSINSNKSYVVGAKNNSLSLGCNGGNTASVQGEKIIVDAGKSYKIGYMATDGKRTNVSMQAQVIVYDANSEIARFTGEVVYTTEEWQEVFVEFITPEKAVSVAPVITATFNETSSDTDLCLADSGYCMSVPKEDVIKLKDGASLRLVKETPGIRFYASVDKQVYDKYQEDYQNVSAGILITLTEYLQDVSDYTVENLVAKNIQHAEIPVNKWANSKTTETDGFYGFYCALVNILPHNVRREFSVRAYVKYDKDGKTVYEYSSYDSNKNSRSVYGVALLAKQEIEKYSTEQADIIEYYATYVYEE